MTLARFYSVTTESASLRSSKPTGSASQISRPELATGAITNGVVSPRPEMELTAQYAHVPMHIVRHRMLIPVNTINPGTLTGLRYARSLSNDVTAVHVSMDADETKQLQKDWLSWGEGVRLVILDSPHQMVLEPLLRYIQSIMALKQTNEVITVVVPQSIHPRWWSNLTRTQMAVLLRLSLPFETGIVITDVPYELQHEQ